MFRKDLTGSAMNDLFVDAVMGAHNLQQINFSVTRGDHNLDLALCSDDLQATCQVGDDIFASDHSAFSITLNILPSLKHIKSKRLNHVAPLLRGLMVK